MCLDGDDNLDEHFKIFKSKFLDEHSNIKADVCDVLERWNTLNVVLGEIPLEFLVLQKRIFILIWA